CPTWGPSPVPSPTLSLPRPRKRTTEARRGPLVAAGLVVAAAVGGAGWWGWGPAHLTVLGTVPAFAVAGGGGGPVTAATLAGHVWIADFVFTRCPDFCPALTSRMATLQRRLATGDDPIQLVSFSVDPANDTPAVLREYATRAGA